MAKTKEDNKRMQQLRANLTDTEHQNAKIQAIKEGKTFTDWLSDLIRSALGASN